MSKEQIAENVIELLKQLGSLHPGGSNNIYKLHLKPNVNISVAVPVYINTGKCLFYLEENETWVFSYLFCRRSLVLCHCYKDNLISNATTENTSAEIIDIFSAKVF